MTTQVPTDALVEQAYQAGDLGAGDATDYSLLAIVEPDRVPEDYRPTGGTDRADAFTFLRYWDDLSPQEQAERRDALTVDEQPLSGAARMAAPAPAWSDCADNVIRTWLSIPSLCRASTDIDGDGGVDLDVLYNVEGSYAVPTDASEQPRPALVRDVIAPGTRWSSPCGSSRRGTPHDLRTIGPDDQGRVWTEAIGWLIDIDDDQIEDYGVDVFPIDEDALHASVYRPPTDPQNPVVEEVCDATVGFDGTFQTLTFDAACIEQPDRFHVFSYTSLADAQDETRTDGVPTSGTALQWNGPIARPGTAAAAAPSAGAAGEAQHRQSREAGPPGSCAGTAHCPPAPWLRRGTG